MQGRLAGPTAPSGTRRRVVFVTYYYSPYVSGLSLHVQGLAEGLAALGLDVHVVAGRHQPHLPLYELVRGVTIHRKRVIGAIDKGIVIPGLLPASYRLAGRGGILIPVLPLGEAAAFALLPLRGRRLLPLYICDLRLRAGFTSRGIERFAHWGARRLIARAPAVLASSREYVSASRVIGGVSTPVIEAPPPIDTSRFFEVESENLAARLGAAGSPRVGFVGRLVAEKGLETLIRSFQKVREQHSNAQLIIAGEGDSIAGGGLRAKLARLAGDAGDVLFTGFLPDEDLAAFYSMLDVLVLPSVDPLEAYGMVQIEAMLCGTPVVASSLPGVRIPISRTGMGVLTPPGDEHALSEGVLKVLGDKASYARSREEVLLSFDPAAVVASLHDEITALP